MGTHRRFCFTKRTQRNQEHREKAWRTRALDEAARTRLSGLLGFKCPQHSSTTRPSVERTATKAFLLPDRQLHREKARRTCALERLVIYCQTTGVSAAHATHCATYCTPCRQLIQAFSGWIRTPPPTCALDGNARARLSVDILVWCGVHSQGFVGRPGPSLV